MKESRYIPIAFARAILLGAFGIDSDTTGFGEETWEVLFGAGSAVSEANVVTVWKDVSHLWSLYEEDAGAYRSACGYESLSGRMLAMSTLRVKGEKSWCHLGVCPRWHG